jgi:hypothetical protein
MRVKLLILAGIFVAYGSSAFAMSIPGQDHLSSTLQYPGAPKRVYDDEKQPYAMNYADEAARNLGVKDGHMDVFSTQPTNSGYMPSISGGLGGDGAMVRLRWHPGE